MPGRSSLPTFAFRALVLVPLVSLLWIGVAERYNRALVSLARPLAPEGLSVEVLGRYILFEEPGVFAAVSIDGFTLHFGLILLAVLVLAAVGVGVAARIG